MFAVLFDRPNLTPMGFVFSPFARSCTIARPAWVAKLTQPQSSPDMILARRSFK